MELEVVDSEKNKWCEMDVNMDSAKKGRRSSILKPQKPRNPLSILDFSETNPDNVSVRASRRVSFASSNFVKPFAADPEKNTIWDTTYEEEVNHTDSTKSSCDQTHGTKTSQMNMTSIYSTTSEEIFHNEIAMGPSTTSNYIDVESTKLKIVNNVENAGVSLVSFARKLRSNSTSEQNMNKTMDFTLIDSAGSVSAIKVVDEENSKPQRNVADVVSFNKTGSISCTTKLTENTMEITSCITDKENVNPLINDLSVLMSQQNNTGCRNKTEYFNEDLEFTAPLKKNEETDYCNISGITNLETVHSKMDINNPDSVMEFTCTTSEDIDNCIVSGGELQMQAPKRGHIRTTFKEPLITNRIGDASLNAIHLDDSLNTMEFPNVRKLEIKQNELEKIDSRSKRKTIIFNETEGNMELTREITIRNDGINSQLFKNTAIVERFQNQIEQIRVQSEVDQTNRTIIFNQSQNDMEITQNKGTFQDILIPTRKEEIIPGSTNMENIENPTQKDVNSSNNKSKRKTIIFNETQGNMELTMANDNFSSLAGNIGERFPRNQSNKTIFFDQSQNNMEFTATFPVKIQNKDNPNTSAQKTEDAEKNRRQTIIFKEAGEDMEFTNTFNIHNVMEQESKEKRDLRTLYSEQSAVSMELTNKLLGKVNFADSPTNVQVSDMELTTALPSKTIAENGMGNLENEDSSELAFPIEVSDNELVESTMDFTHTLVGKLNGFGTSNTRLDDEELTSVSQQKIINQEVTEIVESNENVDLTSNMTPHNMDQLQQSNRCLPQSVDTQLLTSPETQNVNFTNSSTKKTDIVEFTLRGQGRRKSILPVRETSAINDLNNENMIYPQNNYKGDEQSIISKSTSTIINAQNNFICHETNQQSFKNDLSTINVIGGINDIKRHIADGPDDETIKKRRIEKSLTPKKAFNVGSSLPPINEQIESALMGTVKKLSYMDNGEVKLNEIKPNIYKNHETSITSDISNVLYLPPHMSNSPPKFIPSTTFGPNLNLGETLNATTPATSFHINLSCMEDTQQLIHATFSKPETLKMLGDFKDGEQSFNSIYKSDDLQSEEIDKNIEYKLPERGNFDEISTSEEPSIPKLTKEKTFTVEKKKSISENIENPKKSNCYTDLLMDTTPPMEVADESSYSGLDVKLFHDNDSNSKILPESNQYDHSENVSSECMNYTLRAHTVINNIQKYLLRYEPVIPSADSHMRKLAKEFTENCNLIKELCKKKTHMVDLEEVHKEDKDNLSSENEGVVHAKEDSTTPLAKGFVPRKSLCERVCDMAKSTKKYWEYVKTEDDYYYFYTMFGTLPFKVHVHPEIGLVYNVLTYTNLSDIAKPICHYHLKVLQNKLRQGNLLSVLGQNFDIFTLLDYVYISMEEINKFDSEYSKLLKKYGETHHFRMNPDFSITFEILNTKLIIFWIITIKLSGTNLYSTTKEDITAEHKVGQSVNQEHIKTIAENSTKGPNFFRNFIENVDEYVQRIGKRLKK